MLAFAVSMGFLNWEFVQSNTSFLQVSGSCSRHIFQDVDPHLSPVSGREKGLSKRCGRLGPFLMWQDAFQDRSPGSLLEPNARASFESTFDIPFQHRKLNYTIHFKGAPSKCSSSASYIYTSTFEFQTRVTQQQWPTTWFFSTSWWSLSFYFPLDKVEEVHGDFKCQLSLSETEVKDVSAKGTVQSGSSDSHSNWLCTFKCVSSVVNPKDSASCYSQWPKRRLGSSWTVCQPWKLGPSPVEVDIAMGSTEIRLGQGLVMQRWKQIFRH